MQRHLPPQPVIRPRQHQPPSHTRLHPHRPSVPTTRTARPARTARTGLGGAPRRSSSGQLPGGRLGRRDAARRHPRPVRPRLGPPGAPAPAPAHMSSQPRRRPRVRTPPTTRPARPVDRLLDHRTLRPEPRLDQTLRQRHPALHRTQRRSGRDVVPEHEPAPDPRLPTTPAEAITRRHQPLFPRHRHSPGTLAAPQPPPQPNRPPRPEPTETDQTTRTNDHHAHHPRHHPEPYQHAAAPHKATTQDQHPGPTRPNSALQQRVPTARYKNAIQSHAT